MLILPSTSQIILHLASGLDITPSFKIGTIDKKFNRMMLQF